MRRERILERETDRERKGGERGRGRLLTLKLSSVPDSTHKTKTQALPPLVHLHSSTFSEVGVVMIVRERVVRYRVVTKVKERVVRQRVVSLVR